MIEKTDQSITTNALFDCSIPYLSDLFASSAYPWEILLHMPPHIQQLMESGIDGFYEYQKGVLVGESVKIHASAVIEGPAIIGPRTEIRPNAFLRGWVVTGADCVIGNASEVKHAILLNHVQIPHYNYVGDSVIGNHVHLGAAAICSNLKADQSNVIIHAAKDHNTHLRKVGAMLADRVDIGCGCVMNPGTVIGKGTSVYPLTVLRGVYPDNCIIKDPQTVVKRISPFRE